MDSSLTISSLSTYSTTVVKAWTLQLKRMNDLFDSIPEDRMLKEIAPGKNTGVYLLGHLVAVHDAMLPLLGFGQKLYPELEHPFIKSADKTGQAYPPLAELKRMWAHVNNELNRHIADLSPEGWLERHMAISSEDFVKEPHRNRLSVLISRTTHMSYHQGQLVWAK